jgi:hypothetical protein
MQATKCLRIFLTFLESSLLEMTTYVLYDQLCKAVFPLTKVSVIMLATATHDSLALATLGDATYIQMIQSGSHCPRWPRQVKTLGAVAGVIADKCCQ